MQSLFPIALWLSLKIRAIGFQNQTFWGLLFLVKNLQARELGMSLDASLFGKNTCGWSPTTPVVVWSLLVSGWPGSMSHFMANRWGNSGNSVRLYFLGSKITADGDCSHEIKRRFLLGRKVMTNLDSILKNRNITLPTKVCLVRAMFFPVVMYGCESWTVKKAECWRIDAFELWCWRRLLRVPWTARRSTSPF